MFLDEITVREIVKLARDHNEAPVLRQHDLSNLGLFGSDLAGADLSGSVGGVRFEGEFINVFYDYDLADQAGFDMNLTFAHGMLGYWFTDKLFTYGSAEFGTGTFDKGWSHSSLSFGASYLLNSAISAKAQFIVHEQRHDEDEDRAMLKFVFLGLSVLL